MTSSALIDLESVTLRDLRNLRNPEFIAAVRQTIDAAARDYATAIQMQDQ
ncbi:hypothetical protein JOF56_003584 [Kibdelosporangium banguiense]|uniref:FXSXX-COOH protein n=1 Tax=Kibdelosporangium banguiense TaxID=1365924 RepID=A0ABS4TGT7_9PSEU|nr:hypothetical protein [Kibdelosporangium banguiense]MBP2323199.1 hypothetical protein [Kibdelosporangium banguiense]